MFPHRNAGRKKANLDHRCCLFSFAETICILKESVSNELNMVFWLSKPSTTVCGEYCHQQ